MRVESGRVRLYGVEFSKSRPGVLYSSLGVNGANITLLSHAFNGAHWTAQLHHYRPDLVVLAYGTNESGFPKFVDSTWGAEMKSAVKRVQAALPDASILLMSPMDRGERNDRGEIETIAAMPRLVKIEAQVAEETGVAFFNTFQAMGGEGTMARWYAAEPRLVGSDYIHPMPAGAKIVGELLYGALRDGYNEYKLRQLKSREGGAKSPEAAPRSEGLYPVLRHLDDRHGVAVAVQPAKSPKKAPSKTSKTTGKRSTFRVSPKSPASSAKAKPLRRR